MRNERQTMKRAEFRPQGVIRPQPDVVSDKGDVWRACEVDLDGETFYVQETDTIWHVLRAVDERRYGWGIATAEQEQKAIEATWSYFAQE
jgi:hypothetical protein